MQLSHTIRDSTLAYLFTIMAMLTATFRLSSRHIGQYHFLFWEQFTFKG
jgi:hypothetical protein